MANITEKGNLPYRGATSIILILLVLILIFTCIYICVIPPILTDQHCVDYMSGHTPTKAETLYLNKLFEATVNQEYEWLSTYVTDDVLKKLKHINPYISTKYTILGGDDLSGLYERGILFDNGTKIRIIYFSKWPSCPDFNITEEEALMNIRLDEVILISK